MPAQQRYKYKAEVLRIIDGDTIVVRADCGFNTFVVLTVRLVEMDAPEVRGPDKLRGRAATNHLKTLIEKNSPVTITTVKDKRGKFGRYLATLHGRDGRSLNQQMIDDGHAVAYK